METDATSQKRTPCSELLSAIQVVRSQAHPLPASLRPNILLEISIHHCPFGPAMIRGAHSFIFSTPFSICDAAPTGPVLLGSRERAPVGLTFPSLLTHLA